MINLFWLDFLINILIYRSLIGDSPWRKIPRFSPQSLARPELPPVALDSATSEFSSSLKSSACVALTLSTCGALRFGGRADGATFSSHLGAMISWGYTRHVASGNCTTSYRKTPFLLARYEQIIYRWARFHSEMAPGMGFMVNHWFSRSMVPWWNTLNLIYLYHRQVCN